MIWLKFFRDFIKVLSAGQTPRQIAWGFALGSIIGLSPMFTLQGLLIWFIILLIDVNLSAALVAVTFFKLVAYLIDPIFHSFGFYLLTKIDSLQGFYTTLYNAPLAPLTRFNNTVVMGSFVAAILFLIPIYFGMKLFVIQYRAKIHDRLKKWKIYQAIDQSKFIHYYKKVRDLGGLR
jgi:uncharacterized protein (TIGR03546 family)